ncbi:MAG TPA: YbhN family protein [Roseiflexaceae bacterium]|nr:YbhN family protein [Roseiflexaceae bacterium]
MSSWSERLRRMMRRKRFWGALIAMFVVSALSVYALHGVLRSGGEIDFWQVIARIDARMFLFSSLVYAVALALAVVGWGWIISALSGVWNWPQHIRIYCITAITRRLPGTMWYILGRVVMYERLGVGRALVAVGGGLEYAMILTSGLLVALLMWPLALPGQSISPLWLVGGLLLGCAALHPRTLRAVVRRLSPNSAPLHIRYRDLLGWALVYAGVWCFGGGVLYVLATTIHPLTLAALPVIIGIWATAGIVTSFTTFIPFGLGVQELTLTALLGNMVGSPAEALVVALLMRFILTINEVLWALVAGLVGFAATLRTPQDEQTVRSTPDQATSLSNEQKPDEVYKITRLLPRK